MTTPVTFMQHTTVRGKKLPRWTAVLGEFEAQGDDRVSAQAALVALLQGVQPYRRKYLFAKDGTVFSIYNCAGSWGYDITNAARSYPCSSFGRATYEEAVADALRHIDAFGGIVSPSGEKNPIN